MFPLFCLIGTQTPKWRAQDWTAWTLLAVVNAFIAWPLFSLEYSQYTGSLDGVYIALAQYIQRHWTSLDWFATWYAGMPFQNVYQPLFHSSVAAFSQFSGMSAARAYHFVTGMFYCLGPLTLYALLRRFTGNRITALCGALAYSLISPAAILAQDMAGDVGGWWRPYRFHTALAYSDVPHMAAAALLPLSLLCLDRAFQKASRLRVWLTAFTFALVFLTNIPGTIGLALAVFAYCTVHGSKSWWIAGGAAITGYALSAYFTPPSVLRTILEGTRLMNPEVNGFGSRHIVYGFAALILAYGFARWHASEKLRFALLLTLLTGAITLGWFWFGASLIAQPNRFYLELEMAVILLLSTVASSLLRARIFLGGLLLIVFLIGCGYQVRGNRRTARDWVRPIDITKTSEYKVAKWIDENAHGKRVFVSGSTAFWLNAFTDTPQLLGCCDQGLLLNQMRGAYYTMSQDFATREIVTQWLQVFGAQYVAVHGAGSNETFKIFRNPHIFDGYLNEVWRDGDDVIYAVPQSSASVAHAVLRTDLVSRAPVNGMDVAPLEKYVKAIAMPDSIATQWDAQWRASNRLTLHGSLQKDQVISVQVPYHAGWRAQIGGTEVPLSHDGLDFMVIEPNTTGDTTVDLTWNGGVEKRAAAWVSALALASLLLALSRYAKT